MVGIWFPRLLTALCHRWALALLTMASSSETSCYRVVFDSSESPTQKLRASLEKGSDKVRIDTLHIIIIATSNGHSQVCFVVIAL
jgi:hypothetical protein